jgi:hypothetical protein
MNRQNSYKFVWHKNVKYGTPITRTTWIKTAGSRQDAVNIFMSVCGNLKKNTVETAEEYTRQGMYIFQPEVIKQNGRYVAV